MARARIELRELTLQSISEIEPTLEPMFRKIMRDLARDCENRPYDNGVRACSLKFKLTPVLDEATGELDYIELETEGKPGIPVYRTRKSQLRSDQGRLVYNADLPGSIDQPSLYPNEGSPE